MPCTTHSRVPVEYPIEFPMEFPIEFLRAPCACDPGDGGKVDGCVPMVHEAEALWGLARHERHERHEEKG